MTEYHLKAALSQIEQEFRTLRSQLSDAEKREHDLRDAVLEDHRRQEQPSLNAIEWCLFGDECVDAGS